MARKWWLIISASGFLLAITCTYLALTIQALGFYAVQPTKDLGTVGQGESKRVEYQLRNDFDQAVKITDVVQQCTCTDITFSKQVLQPNDQATVSITWETGRARGPVDLSNQVIYTLEDGRVSRIGLRMVATVQPDITYAPTELRFVEGKSESKTVHFTPGVLSHFSLKKAYCTHKAFHPRLVSKSSVVLTFDPSEWPENEVPGTYLVVETTSKNEPSCRIPILVSSLR